MHCRQQHSQIVFRCPRQEAFSPFLYLSDPVEKLKRTSQSDDFLRIQPLSVIDRTQNLLQSFGKMNAIFTIIDESELDFFCIIQELLKFPPTKVWKLDIFSQHIIITVVVLCIA